MASLPPPEPMAVLRGHTSEVNCLCFGWGMTRPQQQHLQQQQLLASGDSSGDVWYVRVHTVAIAAPSVLPRTWRNFYAHHPHLLPLLAGSGSSRAAGRASSCHALITQGV
eukprot:COSAG01_NODE_77_length_28297_cov_104.096230_31_plen_110_part_00